MQTAAPFYDYFGLQLSSGAAVALQNIAERLGKIEAIAMVRWKTGMGLVESKEWVEKFLEERKRMQPKETAFNAEIDDASARSGGQ